MYAIAVIGDILSLIPFLNVFSGICTAIALGIAGSHSGISLYSSDRAGGTFVAMLVELVPGISMVPAWTIRVYLAKKQHRLANGGS